MSFVLLSRQDMAQNDASYFGTLKAICAGLSVKVVQNANISQLPILQRQASCTAFITTDSRIVQEITGNKKATSDMYAGSILTTRGGLPLLVIPPLEQLQTVPYGKHFAARMITKLTKPENWYQQSELSWEVATPATLPAIFARFQKDAKYIATDIETRKELLRMTCVGYCAVFADGSTHSIVIPTDDIDSFMWIEKFNSLPQPKIFQNGMYDNAYFLRWGTPATNWLFDTLHLFHSWYSEMPKSLDFLAAYLVRDFKYWKHESEAASTMTEYYFYNAKDTWVTANAFMAIMKEAPDWAIKNYLQEFPLVYPCLHVSMEGIAISEPVRSRIELQETKKLEDSLDDIRKSLGSPNFNPSSPVQVKKLFQVLGSKDITSSDAKAMAKVMARHPLNEWFLSRIIKYRKARKLLSSYLEATLLNGRFMYALNPAGTDTGRMASKESHFWCGSQIQNIPPSVKEMFIPDEGYLLAEIDYAQSEARCVGYVAGDEKLIAVVESDKDYHCANAELFFGILYDIMWDWEKGKIRPEWNDLRQLAKRTNHGANYNMGAGVMLETMGMENVLRAKALLKLPAHMDAKSVCQHLLDTYAKTYPHVKGRWYDKIKLDVATGHKLVSALGWTRYCFGNPNINKQALNAYVAHVPQNLSVAIINIAFMRVWRDLAIPSNGALRLKAQVHDSILFQYKADRPELVQQVADMMRVPVQVRGSDNKVRTLVIPSDTKSGITNWLGK